MEEVVAGGRRIESTHDTKENEARNVAGEHRRIRSGESQCSIVSAEDSFRSPRINWAPKTLSDRSKVPDEIFVFAPGCRKPDAIRIVGAVEGSKIDQWVPKSQQHATIVVKSHFPRPRRLREGRVGMHRPDSNRDPTNDSGGHSPPEIRRSYALSHVRPGIRCLQALL